MYYIGRRKIVRRELKTEIKEGEKSMLLEKAKERAFDRVTMLGESADIYRILYSYKAIRELPDSEVDAIYVWICKGQGFTNK